MSKLQDYIQKALQYRTDRLAAAGNEADDIAEYWNDIGATEIGGLNPTSTFHTFNPANFNLTKARKYVDSAGDGNFSIRDALGLLSSTDATGLSDHDLWELFQKGFGSIPTGFANPYTQTSTNTDTNTNTMNYTDNQKIVQDLYGRLLGRQAADEGMSYWTGQLDSGKTVEDLTRAIKSGSEFKNRSSVVDAYRAANAGANPTEAYLDARVAPGGGTLDPNDSSVAPTFGANNTWSGPLQNTGNNTHTDELEAIVNQLGGYNTAPNKNLGAVTDATHNPDGTLITGGGSNNNTTGNWYDGYASGADWLAANPQAGSSSSSSDGGMDEFMKFMMLMAVMPRGGGGGGYGGSQYGYGGLNPGGVQAAYNPWENVKTGWNFMKDNFGSGASTATVNTQ